MVAAVEFSVDAEGSTEGTIDGSTGGIADGSTEGRSGCCSWRGGGERLGEGSAGRRRDREPAGEGRSAGVQALSSPTDRLPVSGAAAATCGASLAAEVMAGGAADEATVCRAGASRCAPSEPGIRPAPSEASRPTPLGFSRIAIAVIPRPIGCRCVNQLIQ